MEIQKGMYGLKEASILAFEQIKAHLALHGYTPMAFTPGLWKHKTRRTTFTLAVDDFGIKYFSNLTRITFSPHSKKTSFPWCPCLLWLL
jgi:hypothetical protein